MSDPSRRSLRTRTVILRLLALILLVAAGTTMSWLSRNWKQRELIHLICENESGHATYENGTSADDVPIVADDDLTDSPPIPTTSERVRGWFTNLRCSDYFHTVVKVEVDDWDDARLKLLRRFPDLQSLNVGGCEISNDGLATLAKLPELSHLGLRCVAVDDVGLAHLARLTKLTWLSIQAEKFSAVGLSRLAQLPELTTLHLSSKRITQESFQQLSEFPKLQSLNFMCTYIVDARLSHLKQLTSLRELRFWNCSWYNVSFKDLESITTLESLALTASINGDELKDLVGLKNLRNLALVGNPITDEELTPLSGLANLRFLDLRGTEVTAAGIARLQRALPRCKILEGRDHGFGDMQYEFDDATPSKGPMLMPHVPGPISCTDPFGGGPPSHLCPLVVHPHQ